MRLLAIRYIKIASELLLITCVGVTAMNHESATIVEISSFLALLSCLGVVFNSYLLNKEKGTLILAEAQERECLRSILTKVAKGEKVDEALVKRAHKNYAVVEKAYKSFYGYSRSSALPLLDRAVIEQAKRFSE